jgi:cytochrome c-type biogenesis protein CcsB
MTKDHFALLSNWGIAVAAAFYFLALLLHLAEWASARAVPVDAASVGLGGGSTTMAAVGGGTTTLVATEVDDDTEAVKARMARFARNGVRLTVAAAVAHFVAVLSRGLAADPVRVPWGNMYEFAMTATFVVTVAYLLLYRKYQLTWLSPVVTAFVLVTLMVDVLELYDPVVPLRDALQSPWLVIHVVSAIIATGAFTLGGMTSIAYLVKERWLRKHAEDTQVVNGYIARLPGLVQLDRFAYRTHAFAFPVWTFAALITGPIWAQAAWGRYWGWDPKEVWAFITWVVYAAYLHARATAGWKGKAAAIVALIGLATLWFNFIGINFFFGNGSMHSYA